MKMEKLFFYNYFLDFVKFKNYYKKLFQNIKL